MATIYVSPGGNDDRDGLSELNAWKSLEKIRREPLKPGDTIRLRRGAVYHGSIDLSWLPDGPVGGGASNEPITFLTYGDPNLPVPEVRSPVDKNGFSYSGPGGISVESIRFRGSVANPKNQCFGVSLTSQDGSPVQNCALYETEITGYVKGIRIHSGKNVSLGKVNLWGCGLATYLWDVHHLTLFRCNSWENDWIWETALADGGNQGQGFSLYNCSNTLIQECRAFNNGLLTTLNCGPAGFNFQDCDTVKVYQSLSYGNGDGSGEDGQGFIFYGCRDSLIRDSEAYGNLSGFSLFNDPFCRTVERCRIEKCLGSNNTIDLAMVGNIWDSAVVGSRFYGVGPGSYKTFDIADATAGKDERRKVEIIGNEFRARLGVLLVEAVPGIDGLDGLEANIWDGTGFRIKEVQHTYLYEVLRSFTKPPIPSSYR